MNAKGVFVLMCLNLVFTIGPIPLESGERGFVSSYKEYESICNDTNVIVVGSVGHSGSTMLYEAVVESCEDRPVIKTHCLPPPKDRFQGKIIYIYSDPHKSIESLIHKATGTLKAHMRNMQTGDKELSDELSQGFYDDKEMILKQRLLQQDLYGYFVHLDCWLRRLPICDPEQANVLAIKYENLWEEESIKAIRFFLQDDSFQLPFYRPRGDYELTAVEINARNAMNLGSKEHPRYKAYDDAWNIWNTTPSIQWSNL